MYGLSRDEVEAQGRFGSYAEIDGGVATVWCLNTFDIVVPIYDLSIAECLIRDGFWEAWITAWATQNVKPGMKVVDIGANYGYYTMLFATLVGIRGAVMAYEPHPDTAGFLEATLRGVQTPTTLIRAAVSDSMGEATLSTPGDFTGSASIVDHDFNNKYQTSHVKVDTTTLDEDFWYVNETPDLIKVDAEGAEELIWNGAARLRSSEKPPVWLMEFSPNSYSDTFIDELFAYGTVNRIREDGQEEAVTKRQLQELTDWDALVIRK